MWQYFSQLYKHANKGIKGRGKDRRISITGISPATALSLASSAEGFSTMAVTAPAQAAPIFMSRTATNYSVQGDASTTSNSSRSSPYMAMSHISDARQQQHDHHQHAAAYNMGRYVG